MSSSLSTLYKTLLADANTVYVVPRIREEAPETDYLYTLYKPLIDQFTFKSLLLKDHFKLLLARVFDRKAVLHYHWIEFQSIPALFGLIYKLVCVALFKAFKGKMVWTIHNPKPHGGKFIRENAWLMQVFAKLADHVVVHCEAGKQFAQNELKIEETRISVLPHPRFTANSWDRSYAIEALNEIYDLELTNEDTILLFFGNIAAYKQIDLVLDHIENWPEHFKLLIAGPIKPQEVEYARLLVAYARDFENVIFIPEYIEDDIVPAFFSSASALLHNSDDGFSSGSIELARAYGLPVYMHKWGCYSTSDEVIHLLTDEQSWSDLPTLLEGS